MLLLAARQRSLLAPARAAGDGRLDRARRRLPAAAGRRGRRHRAVPRRPRRDPDVRPRADRRVATGSSSRRRLSDWRVLQPNDPDPEAAELAVAPGARSAMVYVLGEDGAARSACAAGCCARLRAVEGVDVLAWMEGDEACVWTRSRRAAVRARDAPDRPPRTTLGPGRAPRRRSSSRRATGVADEPRLPGRAAPRCGPRCTVAGAGDVLVSAQRGYEFVDWGGSRPRRRRQPRLAAPRRLARPRSRS